MSHSPGGNLRNAWPGIEGPSQAAMSVTRSDRLDAGRARISLCVTLLPSLEDGQGAPEQRQAGKGSNP